MKGIILLALLAGATVTGMHFSKSAAADTKNKLVTTATVKAPESSKKDAVKLYPNPSYNGTVTISSNSERPLHFYVFDLEGTLLHQIILKDKTKQTIHNLKKGTYVYDAFLNDEGIDHGSIQVR